MLSVTKIQEAKRAKSRLMLNSAAMLSRGSRRILAVAFGACACALPFTPSCDASVKVGELREDDPPATVEAGPLVPPPDAATLPISWKQHAPLVPCSIYAMAEARADDLWLGCNGGRLYRYDGVQARIALSVDEGSIVSLLALGPGGEVWAGAQVGYGDAATTTLHRYDGAAWHDVPGPKTRVTSLASDGTSVWLTTDRAILRLVGGAFQTVYTAPTGTFRACTFDAKHGYCVGTAGLAVAWDGAAWTPVAAPPWSAQAEVLGVEIDAFTRSDAFFYAEPMKTSTGSHRCTAARFTGTFAPLAAGSPCFVDFDVARRRTGIVSAALRDYLLVAPQAQYGGALAFDPVDDAVRPLCGAVVTFATGLANTRAGGLYGLLATLVGAGGNQIALTSSRGSSTRFEDLAVAADGTAWARVEDTTACGTITDTLVRFEPDATWGPVAGPQGAQSGRGLAATSRDRAYTIDLGRDVLLQHGAETWSEGPVVDGAWTLFAARSDDVWIGGVDEQLGHFDGKTYREVLPEGRRRQIEQIVTAGADVWMIAQGVVAGDTDRHVVRWSAGKTTEWNVGLEQARLAAVDATHVWRAGEPAQAWDGSDWKPLPFDASHVWARAADEVYFTDRGDIARWDGKRLERMHHGFIPIDAIAGSADRAFAVGRGGLTLELGRWPGPTR
jgi:hypothetical protein